MDFRDYQDKAKSTITRTSGFRLLALFGLAGEVGSIFSALKKGYRSKNQAAVRDELTEELGDALWYLSAIATTHGISLEEVAQKNVVKTESFFGSVDLGFFDADFPPEEQIPRELEVTFVEKRSSNKCEVLISVNGVIIGDRVTDNSSEDDGYRFHDAFHLAYAAILGWSPVVRDLLRHKRKSDPKIDEVEDGARARAIEESISAFVFAEADRHSMYESPTDVPFVLTKAIMRITQGLEVSACKVAHWNLAISEGFRVFDKLRRWRGGIVTIDLHQRAINVRQLKPSPKQVRKAAKAKTTRARNNSRVKRP
ncbi:MAG: nucleoside triphosphate pyrophosphohydrolase family protein [Pseudomonadota bacterium]